MKAMYVLSRQKFREPEEYLGVYHSPKRAMDGRRGPWHPWVGGGQWRTPPMNAGGVVRQYVYIVRELPVKDAQ